MTETCTICGRRLDDGRPVQQGLDGDAHVECLEAQRENDEGGDDV